MARMTVGSSLPTAGLFAIESRNGYIEAALVDAVRGGRPRWIPSTPSGSAISVRNSSRMSLPVTERASPASSHPKVRAWYARLP
ncbi:Uncharacterised protein [Mycobacteroides abscessus]|nr:Uncharacterised protein [Mycobacteroides abscessus]